MSDTVNPWQSPEAPAQAEENAAQGILTAVMIRYLKEASPWLRFIGILGYIGAGFLILSGLITAIIALATGVGLWSGVPNVIGFVYVPFGVAAFLPARFTYRFGMKIRHYLASGAEKDLEEAFKNNKSLWKFSGILAIVYLALLPAAVIVGVIVVVSGLS
ncbi:MAG: hypothetical protein LBB77_10705 [Treponema sp.]|jgi:hypothetical protein|nr:hypothetical protein [Treponema sp.]